MHNHTSTVRAMPGELVPRRLISISARATPSRSMPSTPRMRRSTAVPRWMRSSCNKG